MSNGFDISLAQALDPCCRALGDLLSPRFFKALGDPNRIVLLSRLAASCRPCTVTEMSGCCPVDVSVVSRHLAMLRDADIVQAERRGKEVLYTVRYDVLAETFRGIADAIEACCVNPPQSRKEPDDG
ncbi:MAG: ArsR/SmtB family transcription factor [Planctomycetota bacterium]|jgi:DNA-binding transcriptional ArsR family regulator